MQVVWQQLDEEVFRHLGSEQSLKLSGGGVSTQ